ncbi:MAG: hypothetical protein KJ888_20325 [Gammaproteobacteria bacterium]|nr:hypothetical protein [Gammaproteobacteria bacterium]
MAYGGFRQYLFLWCGLRPPLYPVYIFTFIQHGFPLSINFLTLSFSQKRLNLPITYVALLLAGCIKNHTPVWLRFVHVVTSLLNLFWSKRISSTMTGNNSSSSFRRIFKAPVYRHMLNGTIFGNLYSMFAVEIMHTYYNKTFCVYLLQISHASLYIWRSRFACK